ncbi:ABC transporter substrate-binding protein [Komagataeibacter sp. FNDCF1]|uniref:ABC transporter substrate-binding protein n=1 Tax=Komagataeibacter sp. FNDCF1 TaxID=2878681 RepID=UPI001E468B08|nr:ABC transporter substrate-binding protein [Komagataeibacter sp. FNDCF1]MCE2565312.1 ABC transporter substrate-binding protein [Komagataeibacter sp. FNDCF1]
MHTIMRAIGPAALLACALLASPARAASQQVTVVLDWFLNADHASLLAAQYSGAFARHGLDVKLIAPADPGSPARLVAAGQADMAISYQTQLGMLAEQDIPLVRVGTLIDTPLNVLIARDGITDLAGLKGRTIGISMPGVDDAALDAMLHSAGLAMSDVRQVNVNFQLEQAIISHAVDGVIGAARTYELLDLQQKGIHVSTFFPEEHGVPMSDELIFLVSRAHVHDAWIRAFMDALAEGTNTLINHPDAMLAQAIHDHPELDTPLNRAAWQATLPRLCKQPALLNVPRYTAFAAFLHAHGIMTRDVPLGQYAVDPFSLPASP